MFVLGFHVGSISINKELRVAMNKQKRFLKDQRHKYASVPYRLIAEGTKEYNGTATIKKV